MLSTLFRRRRYCREVDDFCVARGLRGLQVAKLFRPYEKSRLQREGTDFHEEPINSLTDNAIIYKGLGFVKPEGIPSMKMHTLDHRRASPVAARISLVFYDRSSRVSPKQSDRLRGAHGLSGRSLVRVL
jgi:hypothetical protein